MRVRALVQCEWVGDRVDRRQAQPPVHAVLKRFNAKGVQRERDAERELSKWLLSGSARRM